MLGLSLGNALIAADNLTLSVLRPQTYEGDEEITWASSSSGPSVPYQYPSPIVDAPRR
jgi:hypothetical protein